MKKALTFLAIYTLLIACKKNNDVSPIDVTGKWNLNTIDSNVEFSSDSPQVEKQDVTSQGIYIEFKADGTYITNSDLGIASITKKETGENTGTYELKNGVIALNFVEADLAIPLKLYFQAEVNNNQLVISLDRDDLVKSFAELGSGVDAFSQAILQILVADIVKINYALTFSK